MTATPLKKRGKLTEEQLAELRILYGSTNNYILSERYGVSRTTILRNARKLGLKKNGLVPKRKRSRDTMKVSDADIEEIHRVYPTTNTEALARKYGISKHYVYKISQRGKVKKDKEYKRSYAQISLEKFRLQNPERYEEILAKRREAGRTSGTHFGYGQATNRAKAKESLATLRRVELCRVNLGLPQKTKIRCGLRKTTEFKRIYKAREYLKEKYGYELDASQGIRSIFYNANTRRKLEVEMYYFEKHKFRFYETAI